MITIEQCRAARGLLDWTQQDLAQRAHLSKTAINNFEKGYSAIKADSLRAIRAAFEDAGIEFIDNVGLTRKSDNARILKGEAAFANLIRDIEKYHGGEILVCHGEPNFSPASLLNTMNTLLKDLDGRRLPVRLLGTKEILSERTNARFLPADKDAEPCILKFLYGQKAAFILGISQIVIIIDSREASDVERRHFEDSWSTARIMSRHNRPDSPSKKAT